LPRQLFTGINHVCVVTSDIDRAVRVWWERYGVGPWTIYRYDGANMSADVDGEPTDFAMRTALANLSPTFRMELMEPLDGRSPYAKSLTAHDGADHVHHVRFEVDDYEGVRSALSEHGLHELMHARFRGAEGVASRFVSSYFASEGDLGLIAEVGYMPPDFRMPDPEELYPPA
jgi:methylmalonyl-CoA/ethylmalonyl-CoA epimerase